jgi:hypothetical protein
MSKSQPKPQAKKKKAPVNRFQEKIDKIKLLADKKFDIPIEEVRVLINLISQVFTVHLVQHNFDKRQVVRLTTKLRDAGRRSPPWKAHSARVPGRPQDGSDGNRISRWLLAPDHKFHAPEVMATLVEVKYYLQCLSFKDAPPLPADSLQTCFSWLVDHIIEPGNYVDPIQKIPISLNDVVSDASTIQSGHLTPLDRQGKHDCMNTFLMLKRSNALQGNLTVDELLELMNMILKNHKKI